MYQPRSLPTGDSPGKKDKASEPVIMLGGAVLGGPARLRPGCGTIAKLVRVRHAASYKHA